jgi:YidC/Oxa1 family membrane protein insertase
MASTQKMMLYMLPFIYVITGPGMPIGVLIYWLTTNVWTFVQQYIVIRATPTPGSDAEKDRQERINAKRAKKGLEPLDFTPPKKVSEPDPEPERNIRVQPSAKNKGGKKLTDEEKLERAREARAKAAEERRKAQEAAGETPPPSQGGSGGPLNKGGKKKRTK